jgi:hypothetical protein
MILTTMGPNLEEKRWFARTGFRLVELQPAPETATAGGGGRTIDV